MSRSQPTRNYQMKFKPSKISRTSTTVPHSPKIINLKTFKICNLQFKCQIYKIINQFKIKIKSNIKTTWSSTIHWILWSILVNLDKQSESINKLTELWASPEPTHVDQLQVLPAKAEAVVRSTPLVDPSVPTLTGPHLAFQAQEACSDREPKADWVAHRYKPSQASWQGSYAHATLWMTQLLRGHSFRRTREQSSPSLTILTTASTVANAASSML